MHIVARGLFGLSLAAAAAPAGAATPVDEVIATERRFAAETRERGFKAGFLAYVAPDGFLFQPDPRPARPGLEALPDAAPPGPPLFWWPDFAGASLSGDLGFTSGGATIPVRYFTVWRRQPDGSLKWIYDGGPPLAAPMAETGDAELLRIPPATASAGSAEAALAEIAPLEAALAEAARTDAAAAYLPLLAEEALLAGSGGAAATPGREGQEAELARRAPRADLRPLGATASRAGDLVFAWGEMRWSRGEQARWGHYARIWQKRAEGWRIVADMLVPAPGAPPG